jgi:Zn finger protein HypA/HybF involved in hydrogenase expression
MKRTHARCPRCGLLIRGHGYETSESCPRCSTQDHKIVPLQTIQLEIGHPLLPSRRDAA